jgi:hypothetical protein
MARDVVSRSGVKAEVSHRETVEILRAFHVARSSSGSSISSQEVEPHIGSPRFDLEDFRAHHIVDDKGIVIHSRLELRQGRPLCQNPAAQLRLNAAREQENAIIEATLDPSVMAFHELACLALVDRKLQQYDKHQLTP